jgi:toxin ParE1/3/4
MPVKRTPQAEADLIDIFLESAQRFGTKQAEIYAAKLSACFELLETMPSMARERLEISPPVRVHFHGSHVIAYVLDGDDIVLLRVLHERRDWEGELQ